MLSAVRPFQEKEPRHSEAVRERSELLRGSGGHPALLCEARVIAFDALAQSFSVTSATLASGAPGLRRGGGYPPTPHPTPFFSVTRAAVALLLL